MKYGLGTPDGNIRYNFSRPTGNEGSVDEIKSAFIEASRELLKRAKDRRLQVTAAGVGTPGAVDKATGTVFGSSPNVPGVVGLSIKSLLEEELKLPVVVDNDGNMAVLGEALVGAGREYRTVFGVTLGTGIGGGYIRDGVPVRGEHGSAMEVGHTVVAMGGRICACGKRGHIEAYSSGGAIIRRTNQLAAAEGKYKGEFFTGTRKIFEAAEAGYSPAQRAVDEALEALSIFFANMINTLDPGCIVVGGGVLFGFLDYWRELEKRVAEKVVDALAGKTPILPAQLGNMAGMTGAILAAGREGVVKLSLLKPDN